MIAFNWFSLHEWVAHILVEFCDWHVESYILVFPSAFYQTVPNHHFFYEAAQKRLLVVFYHISHELIQITHFEVCQIETSNVVRIILICQVKHNFIGAAIEQEFLGQLVSN